MEEVVVIVAKRSGPEGYVIGIVEDDSREVDLLHKKVVVTDQGIAQKLHGYAEKRETMETSGPPGRHRKLLPSGRRIGKKR